MRVRRLGVDALRPTVETGIADGWRFATLVADEQHLDYAFVTPTDDVPVVVRATLVGAPRSADVRAEVPSIALLTPAASWAEREVSDLHGVRFTDSPDPRPFVHHEDWPAGLAPLAPGAQIALPVDRTEGQFRFRHVEGEGVMEIRVGPIHAGIIEPGHFRFSTIGETVLDLEVRLGYVHRGVEKAALGMPPAAAVILGERVSGTASVGHALALARAVEDALGIDVPDAHALVRSFLLELERLYNHAGDLGNLCAGTALTGLLAEGLVIKERLLEANHQLSGSRYLRNLVGIGGVRRAPPAEAIAAALVAARRGLADLEKMAEKFFGSASNVERLTGTGYLAPEHARNLGCVGVVARASGLRVDSRAELRFPSTIDEEIYARCAVVTHAGGDVAARARVRLEEARASLILLDAIAERLRRTPPGRPAGGVAGGTGEGLGWAEGARGEIMTYVRVGAGKITRLRVRSPSRMNWPAIEHAMPGNIVPDFPLINKSFNLSYAGCDL